MNIEIAYIKCNDNKKICEIISQRLNGQLDIQIEYDNEIPSSYSEYLEGDIKRKVLVSPENNGWITIVESKEYNDYDMLIYLSKELETEIIAIAQFDSVGAGGYAVFNQGKVMESYFSEEDEDIEERIEEKLEGKAIQLPIPLFRDCVRDKSWVPITTKVR